MSQKSLESVNNTYTVPVKDILTLKVLVFCTVMRTYMSNYYFLFIKDSELSFTLSYAPL